MKSILIYYFSGTGNTEKVVHMLEMNLKESGCRVDLIAVDAKNCIVDTSLYDLVGIAYPIYGFGTPEIIDRLAGLLLPEKNQPLFFLKTGADFISVNHNSSEGLIKRLEEKGYQVFYDRIILMPCNWLIPYNDNIAKQLFVSAQRKAQLMSRELLSLSSRRYRTGALLRKLSMGIASLEKKYVGPYFGKSLYAGAKCNLCGICVENCPNGNIRVYDGKISVSNNCLSCMRCVYNCPENALKSKGLNFFILKKGYNLDRIIADDLISDDFIDQNTSGYFRHFYKYLRDDSL